MLPIPYATDRPARRVSLATYGLLIINLLVYFDVLLGHSNLPAVYERYGFSPQKPQAWTLLTSLFIHLSIWHLAWNMLFLWLFGSAIEEALGWGLFLLAYFACALAANVLYGTMAHLAHWNNPSVGASGAIAGLLGLFAVRFYKTQICFLLFPLYFLVPQWGIFQVSCLWVIGFYVGKDLFYGVRDLVLHTPPTDANWAHLGGFGLGMLYGLLTKLHAEGRSEYLLQEARAALSKGQWLQAVEAAAKVTKREPDNADAHLLLARSYDVLRQPQRAVECFKQAIFASWKSNDRLQGQRIYLEAMRTYPTFCLDPREQLSLVPDFLQAQEFIQAIGVLAKVVAYYPETPEAETALLRAGQIYLERLNEPERALEMFDILLARYPQTSWRTQTEIAMAAARLKAQEKE
jgi:membrane associated rhomboid family serine protease